MFRFELFILYYFHCIFQKTPNILGRDYSQIQYYIIQVTYTEILNFESYEEDCK